MGESTLTVSLTVKYPFSLRLPQLLFSFWAHFKTTLSQACNQRKRLPLKKEASAQEAPQRLRLPMWTEAQHLSLLSLPPTLHLDLPRPPSASQPLPPPLAQTVHSNRPSTDHPLKVRPSGPRTSSLCQSDKTFSKGKIAHFVNFTGILFFCI